MGIATRIIAVSAAIRDAPQSVHDVVFLLSKDFQVKPPFTDLATSLMEFEIGSSFKGGDEATIWVSQFVSPDHFKPLKAVDHHIICLRKQVDGQIVGTVFVDARAQEIPVRGPDEGKVHPLNFTYRETVPIA